MEASGIVKLSRRRASGVVLGLGGLLAAACGARAGTGGTAGQQGAATGSTPTGFVNPNLSVSVSWLKQNINNPGVRVVDARPAADYAKGHIPGAVNLPVVDTFDPQQQKNYPDTQEKLEALFSERGIGNSVRVITYDGGKETPAARLFWTLEYLGHTNAAVLDGGLKAWQEQGSELSTETPTVAPSKFTSKVDPAKMPSKEQCELAINDKTKVVLDSRSPEEYRGDDVRAKFGGHIPGAVNIDWRENFASGTLLKPAEALREMYVSKGVTPEKEVIAHCQTGQRSSVTYLVLRMLGYQKVGNYAGSWVEWGNDPTTVKAQGG